MPAFNVAFRLLRGGASSAVQNYTSGGQRDTVDGRVGQKLDETRKDSQGSLEEFGPRSVFRGGHSVAPPE